MFTLEVEPPLLSMGAVRQQAAAQRLGTIAAELASAGDAASSAAGEPALAAAIAGCCGDGATAVGALQATVGGLAANLEGAAGLYTTTDHSAMPGL